MNYKIQKNRGGLLNSFWLMSLIVFLILGTNYSIAQTAVAPVNGDGSAGNPYEIATWQNLYWISQSSTEWDKNFIQTADIDFGTAVPAIDTWDGGNGWTPIGDATLLFTGTYDGDSHTIDGLFSNKSIYAGLFGRLSGNVKNIFILNARIITRAFAGTIAGSTSGSTISNCFSSGSVASSSRSSPVGGLVGLAINTTISNCANSALVRSGGILAGGLIGDSGGGVVINNSYNSGRVIGRTGRGGAPSGLVGGRRGATGNNNFWDIETSGISKSSFGTGKTTLEMKTQSTYTGWDFVNTWEIVGDNYPSLRVFIDNSAPVANAGDDQTIDCAPLAGAEVTLNGSGSDEDGDVLTYSWSNGATTASQTLTLEPGVHTLTLTVDDGNASSTPDTVSVTINADVEAPIADIETLTDLSGECSVVVTEAPTATDVCTGAIVGTTTDPLEYTTQGAFVITWTYTDDNGNKSEQTQNVVVNDVTAPEISSTTQLISLWSPNHKYETISLSDFGLSVTDNCGEVSTESLIITKVTSDEDENSNGNGDGNTMNDIVIADDFKSVDLRKEREGKGNGRVYTIYVSVGDGNGNVGNTTLQAEVSHSKKSGAIDDGVAYEVLGGNIIPSSAENENQFALSKNFTPLNTLSNETTPTDFSLSQNYPNPFNPTTTINYGIPKDGMVTLIVYNAQGQLIEEIVNTYQSAGNYSYSFDGSRLSSGVYFYKIITNNFMQTSKMLLIK